MNTDWRGSRNLCAKPAFIRVVNLGLFVLLLVLLYLTAPARFTRAASPPLPDKAWTRIEPQLRKRLIRADPSAHLRFIVEMRQQPHVEDLIPLPGRRHSAAVIDRLQATAAQSQAPIRNYLEQRARRGHVAEITSFWIFNGLVISATPDVAFALARRPDVAWLRTERVYTLPSVSFAQTGSSTPEWNIAHIRADVAGQALGLDGSGVVVAILDTGVDWQHPALRSAYRGYNPKGFPNHQGNWFDATPEGLRYPVDSIGHGTHVTGIILGDDGQSRTGVAPGAQWIAARIFNSNGVAQEAWIHEAFQWVLAPAGDPGLAPDIVNGSWGSRISSDEEFRPDLRALRAAGILPVFSAGNGGPQSATLYSPASLPEAFTVGAVDERDVVATFSSRGPSPWKITKPDVVAPGTNIRSTKPGGTFGVLNGTSMAAPHVVGLAALLLQADPSLSLPQLEETITQTAHPLGGASPNDAYGWGLVDAYQAALVATSSGILDGEIRRQADGRPLPHGRVDVSSHDGTQRLTLYGDAKGHFHAALAPGTYDLQGTAFAYGQASVAGVRISAGLTTTQVFTLTPLPAGALFGRVTEACRPAPCSDTRPLSATVSVQGTPMTTTTEPGSGLYSLALPAGTYTVTVSSWAHRVSQTGPVTIQPDLATPLDVSLPPAPTILLVDSGRWYYDSHAQVIAQTLAQIGYPYHQWVIHAPFDEPNDLPTPDDLHPYDVVIWDSPQDSPGLVGASSAITTYLNLGGNLLLTGQDVAYWDDSGNPNTVREPYFRPYLKARYLADNAGLSNISGLPTDFLAGLSLQFNTPDSAANQAYPDAVSSADVDHAAVFAINGESLPVAVGARVCLPYRTIALGFGLEGVGPTSQRASALDRMLQWFVSPPPPARVQLTVSTPARIIRPGQVTTHTIRLRNSGAETDTYTLTLMPGVWSASLLIDGEPQTLPTTLTVASCATKTLSVQVTVPPDVDWDEVDRAVVAAQSALSPTVRATATVATKTPAPILLVDDDRWYNQESAYETALSANGLRYDYWDTQSGLTSPPADVLALHPIVVWFAGYDWVDTLNSAEEKKLADYLDGGGRLLLSAQDYLYTNNVTEFGAQYLGVLTYTEDLTTTTVQGVAGHPIGDGLGPFTLDYPFTNFSDAVEPTHVATATFVGDHERPVAIAYDPVDRGFATAFFAFPLEALLDGPRAQVLERAVAWLSPLGTSTFTPDRDVVLSGTTVTFTAQLRNRGPTSRYVTLSNTLASTLTFVPGSLTGGGTYDQATHRVLWSGELPGGQGHMITYRAVVHAPAPPAYDIANRLDIDDGTRLTFPRIADLRVDAPDLRASSKVVSPTVATQGDILRYTILLRNTGVVPANAVLTDPLPAEAPFITGSLSSSAGTAQFTDRTVGWVGQIMPGTSVTVTYQARVQVPRAGQTVANEAMLEDGYGHQHLMRVSVRVPARAYLPFLRRGTVGHTSAPRDSADE